MPALGLASPAWLALLLLVLPIAWGGWRSRRERPRALAAAGCRAVAVAAVVLCLAGLHVAHLRPAAGACVVALVDVSASMARGGTVAARTFLARLLTLAGPDDMIGSVAFAGRPTVVAHPARGPHDVEALVPSTFDAAALEPDDTDLGAAVARATPLCPEDRQGALVLFSDGNETTGDVAAELALGGGRMPIHAIAPPPAAAPPAAVRRVIHPAIVPARTTVPVDVVVEARERVTAALQVEAGRERTPPMPLDLPGGLSIITVPIGFEETGTRVVAARLLRAAAEASALPAPEGDAVTVTRPLHVLLVSGREAPVVGAALGVGGLEVETVPPATLGARLPRLDAYHLVVLDDVASAEIARGVLDALIAWVGRGGGLVVTGGPHLFGDPGFVGTPLERALPVTFQSQKPEPKQRDPIALYVIIDRSNSMGYASSTPPIRAGEKMEYAKRAALAVLEQLGPSDLVGAIAFDAQPYQLGALQPLARGGPGLVSRVRSLQYGGGTDFKDALETALGELRASQRRVRHVILLTDGDTNRHANDHVGLIADYARAGISITAVRVGADAANLELLRRIAAETGGEFHHVESLQALPQIMIRDAQRRVDMAADRTDSVARFGTPGAILAGFREEELPPVARWAVTRQRPAAELRLYVERDGRREPLLSTWQYGLGRVAALPLDFQAGAAGWAAWQGFTRLLSELALWAAPAGLPSEYRLRARQEATGTRVDLEALGDEPGPIALRLPRRRSIELRPVAARRFSALVPHLEPGRVHALVRRRGVTSRSTLVVPSRATGREQRTLGSNHGLLARLATSTGGVVAPTPAQVITATPGTARATWPLAVLLIPLALVLTLADVALRL